MPGVSAGRKAAGAMLMHPRLVRRDAALLPPWVGIAERSWRVAWLLPLVVLGSLAGAAVLTPLVYGLLESWRAGGGSPVAEMFLGKSVQRMFSGLRWIVILVMVPLIMRACGFTSLGALGLQTTRGAGRAGWQWYAAGLVLVAALAAAQIAFVPGEPRANPRGLAQDIGQALLTGLVGGLGEQIIFSGFLLRLFYAATFRPWLAVVLTALFFAYAHIKVPGAVLAEIGHTVTWDVGARLAVWTLIGITRGFDPSYVAGLVLLAMTCGALTLRYGSVWPAAGLHAGLITGMLLLQRRWSPGSGPEREVWGTAQMIDGWVPLVVLAVLLAWVILARPRPKGDPAPAA